MPVSRNPAPNSGCNAQLSSRRPCAGRGPEGQGGGGATPRRNTLATPTSPVRPEGNRRMNGHPPATTPSRERRPLRYPHPMHRHHNTTTAPPCMAPCPMAGNCSPRMKKFSSCIYNVPTQLQHEKQNNSPQLHRTRESIRPRTPPNPVLVVPAKAGTQRGGATGRAAGPASGGHSPEIAPKSPLGSVTKFVILFCNISTHRR